MRQRSFIALAVALAILVVGAVGVYAYDKTRDDVIAKGITAGGVDLSGMSPAKARDTLRRELSDPLQKPVVVKYAGKRYKLSPARAKVRIDTVGMVQEALTASQKGNIITRTTRSLTGGSVHKSIPVEVSYSKRAVAVFAKHVKKGVDLPAKDASISFGGGGIEQVESQEGRELDTESLKAKVSAELVEPTADHKVKASVTDVKPKVTTAELGDRYPKVIIVNRGGHQLTLYSHLKVEKSYTIAVGQAGLETPAGQYTIQDKQVNPYWHVPQSAWAGSLAGRVIPPGPTNPIKARWMGIYNGAGIHGTSDVGSLGTSASHGCIRMAIPDVEDLFDRVNVGDPVFIS
jgi:lipoprotein-anchoring transpeptidase ErfK/SrfK